jgi:hypothetical protein
MRLRIRSPTMNKNAIKATLATLGVFIGFALFFWFIVTYPLIIFWGFATLVGGLVVGLIGYIVYCIWQVFYIKFKRK